VPPIAGLSRRAAGAATQKQPQDAPRQAYGALGVHRP